MKFAWDLYLVLLGLGLPLCGCATDASDSGDQPQAAAVVVMHLHSFEPKTVTINSGQTVRWENKSFIWHTVTADPALAKKPEDVALPPGAEPFNSGEVKAGGSYQHTFTAPGTYRYFCQPHELKGMVGEVVVK
jgi:plastocyanin